MKNFNKLYNKIAVRRNFIESEYRHPNIIRYQTTDGYFANVGNSGYYRCVGRRVKATGKILWRVSDSFPCPLEYVGITREEFNLLGENEMNNKINELVSREMDSYYRGDYMDSSDAKWGMVSMVHSGIKLSIDCLRDKGFNDAADILEKEVGDSNG